MHSEGNGQDKYLRFKLTTTMHVGSKIHCQRRGRQEGMGSRLRTVQPGFIGSFPVLLVLSPPSTDMFPLGARPWWQ